VVGGANYPSSAAGTASGGRHFAVCRRLAGFANGIYGMSAASGAALLGLDVGGPDHLGPFVGFINDELAEIGG
jgi:hypothetical protein